MIRALVLFFGLVSGVSGAEESAKPNDPRQPQGNTIVIQQQNQPGVPYRGVPILDDKVFDAVGKEPVQPKTTKSSYSGTERAMDEDANYNTEQRRRWIKTCSPQKAADPKLFRECYEAERDKELQALKASQEAVEQRQSQPLRNTQTDPVSEAQGGTNAFERSDVETTEADESD